MDGGGGGGGGRWVRWGRGCLLLPWFSSQTYTTVVLILGKMLSEKTDVKMSKKRLI